MSKLSITKTSNSILSVQGSNEFSVSTAERSLRPPEGTLLSGNDKNIILGSQEATVFLKGSYSGNILGVTFQWSIDSGTGLTFSDPNSLSTFATIEKDTLQNIVTKLTATKDGIEISDTTKINVSPSEFFSGIIGLSSSVKDISLFNYSFQGSSSSFYDNSVTEVTGGNADTIFWGIPQEDYHGYIIQEYDVSSRKWIEIEFGTLENDSGFFVMPDLNKVYRYLPVWNRGGKIISGYSEGPFKIKEKLEGSLSGFLSPSERTLPLMRLSSSAFGDADVERRTQIKTTNSISERAIQNYSLSSSINLSETQRLRFILPPAEMISQSVTEKKSLEAYLDSSSVSRFTYTLNTLPVG